MKFSLSAYRRIYKKLEIFFCPLKIQKNSFLCKLFTCAKIGMKFYSRTEKRKFKIWKKNIILPSDWIFDFFFSLNWSAGAEIFIKNDWKKIVSLFLSCSKHKKREKKKNCLPKQLFCEMGLKIHQKFVFSSFSK